MNKRIVSIALAFVLVMTMVFCTVSSVSAETDGSFTVTVTPDKTKANPGDTINYIVAFGPVTLTSVDFYLNIPDGLTFVEGKLLDGLTLKTKDFVSTDLHVGGYDLPKTLSAESTPILEFSCKVDDDAQGSYTVTLYDALFEDGDYEELSVNEVDVAVEVSSPAEETTAAPAEDTTAAPAEDTTAAPAEDTTAAPAEDTTAAPAEDTTAAPAEDTTAAPAEDTTAAPVPAEETTDAPAADLNVTGISNYCSSPEAQTVKVGNNVTVTFVAPATMDVVSLQWGATFPTDKLEFVSADSFAADMLTSTKQEPFNVSGNASNLTEPYPVAEGEKFVALTFKVVGDGDAEVNLNVIDLLKKSATSEVPTPVVLDSVIQDEPAEETTAVPAEETTEAPAEETTEAPAEDTTAAPAEETTDAPAEETTDAPAEETTDAPAEETTDAPAEETTEAPAEETTDAPAEETTEAPAEETTEAPAEETTEAPAEETTEAPAEDTTPVPAEETTAAPAEDTTAAPAEETTEAPAEDTTAAPATTNDVLISGINVDEVFGGGLNIEDFEVNEDGSYEKTIAIDEPINGVEIDSITVNGETYTSATGETIKFNLTGAGEFKLVLDPDTKTFTVSGDIVEIVKSENVPDPDTKDADSKKGDDKDSTNDSTESEAGGNDNTGAVQTGDASMAVIILLVLVASTAGIYFTRKKFQ